jgi:hypothetical protein
MEIKLNDILISKNEIKSTQTKLINAVNNQGKTLKSFNEKSDKFNKKT